MGGGIIMVFIFVLIASVAIGTMWYNSKYNKNINVGSVMIILFGCIGVFFYLMIKNMSAGEKESIVKNSGLQNTVVEILADSHKRYFKSMKLNNGQILPMPDAMNGILQAGDSIYKSKGEDFYTVVNFKTRSRTKFGVKVHERVLGKPQ